VDFLRQKAAYDVLRGGPALLADESARRQRARSENEEKVKAIEREVAGRHGLLGSIEEARQLDLERVTVLEQITRAHDDWTRKSNERADLDNTKGSHHVRALERLKTFLKGTEITSLMARVGIDDAPRVTRISTIDAEIRILKNDAKDDPAGAGGARAAAEELQEVESHFVSRNYDSSRARFMNGLDFDAYLAGIVRGGCRRSTSASHLDRYRYVEPTPTFSSSSPSLFSLLVGSSRAFGIEFELVLQLRRRQRAAAEAEAASAPAAGSDHSRANLAKASRSSNLFCHVVYITPTTPLTFAAALSHSLICAGSWS
jgi:hypothetical protein